VDSTTALGGNGGRGTLVGRYALRGLIGQGGMADVELALDTILDREVAVKILHARYADDPSFLARFRREAQAAASLNHPNIVAVYDTGEDDGRPFIVMEYVAGQSLRDALRREPVLPQRAAEIVRDAALGLHYAHERGLVHRDIKPGNILISDEGQVKVADFGIARAVSAESVTQTAAVFGTAAYVAPEQAQGESVDRRTDIYALGCVLYELLTSRQPFSADSAVALAYKHVSEPPVPPSRLNPDISPELERVCLKAMAKNPSDRYQTARDFATDLSRAVQGLAVMAPPAAAYATTRMMTGQVDRTMVAVPTERRTVYEDFEEEEPRREGPGAGVWVLGLLILAILAVAGYLIWNAMQNREAPAEPIAFTNVVGRPIDEAEATLRAEGFDVQRADPETSDQPPGIVIATDPPPGDLVPSGSVITLIPSGGPATVRVPSLEGQSVEQAAQTLTDAGLNLGAQAQEPSDTIAPNLVIRSDPAANAEVPEGSQVAVVVSSGPAPLRVPNVQGLDEDDARDTLANFCPTPPCLRANTTGQFSTEAPEGEVISQNPPPNTEVARDSTVELVISDGPPPQTEEPEPTPTPTPTEDEEEEEEEPTPTPTPTPRPSGSEEDVAVARRDGSGPGNGPGQGQGQGRRARPSEAGDGNGDG
jgi:serine/threonine-protein kinase